MYIGMMKRFNVSISDEMEKELEKERKKRYLESIPETIRVVLGEYLAAKKELVGA